MNKTFFLVIIFILGLAIGYFLGTVKIANFDKKIEAPEVFNEQKIKNVSGEIIQLGENSFKVKIAPLPIPDFEEKFPERIVKITSRTKIIKQVSKSQEEIQKELKALEEKGVRNQPVSSSTEKEIGFSELAKGDNVFVEAKEEIKDKQEFEAEKITVYSISQPLNQTPSLPQILIILLSIL